MTTVTKKIFLSVAAIFTLMISTRAQTVDRSRFIKDSLDNYLSRSLTYWRIPGVAICIIKDNKVVLMRCYGIKELGLPAKLDENTLFMIGSNTKAFTATALAMLQERKVLSLDDKVTKYMPDFKLDNKAAGEQTIIRDLLCHRLGFTSFEGDFTFYNTNLTRKEIIQKLAILKPVYPFRAKWGYTNAAFLTAGELVTSTTSRSWESFIKDNIFAPLGMINTQALSKNMPAALNKTAAHTITDGRLTAIPYAQLDGLAPSGSISSSINDMSKWVLALLNNGKVGQREIIPAGAINATWQPQAFVGEADKGGFLMYGLGWYLQDYYGHRVVSHTGSVNGYESSVTLVPDQKLGIVILTNTDQNGLNKTLNWDLIDAYLKIPYHGYNDIAITDYRNQVINDQAKDKRLRDSLALNPQPALPLSAYTGKFTNELYGNMTIALGELNTLDMRFEHHPKMFAHAQPLGGNRFYVTFSDPVLGKAVFPFTVVNGQVTGVRVKASDFVEYGSYEFKKSL